MIYKFYTEGNIAAPFLGVQKEDLVTILQIDNADVLVGQNFSYLDVTYNIKSITFAKNISPKKDEEIFVLCDND